MTIQRTCAVIATLLLFSLSGCAWFGYKSENSPAKLREALEVPPDLARPASDDLAAVPSSGTAAYSDYATKSPAPRAGNVSPASSNGTVAEPASGKVHLERDGAQRWLVVQDNAERVWLRARDFFLRDKMALSVDDPQTAILETGWIDRPVKFSSAFGKLMAPLHSSGLRDKFRVRVERGRVAGTSEVYVSHQGMTEVATEGGANVILTAWQPSPADPEMEAEILSKLLVHFGLDDKQAKVQIAAEEGERGGNAQRVKGELILAGDDLDAAWRRVGQALDRAGVTIEDRDRSAGILYVHYVDSSQVGKRQGIFSWFRGDAEKAGATSDTKNEVPSDRFQVRLKSASAGISVNVFNVKGEPDKSTTGERLLDVIQQQLR